MNKIEIAESFFKQGFNCAQSLLAAYCADFDLEQKKALKIASAFGGGMARTGGVCGFVTGAFMIIGLKYGMADANDTKAKAKTYETARKFIENFKSRNHSIICRKLLGFDINKIKGQNAGRNAVIMAQCTKYILDSVQILDEIL